MALGTGHSGGTDMATCSYMDAIALQIQSLIARRLLRMLGVEPRAAKVHMDSAYLHALCATLPVPRGFISWDHTQITPGDAWETI